MSDRQLHPHQEHGRELLRRSLGSGHRCPVLQAPTAFGKTVLMSAIIDGILARGKRVVVTVPLVQLIDQTVAKLVEWGVPQDKVGVIQSNHWLTDWSKPVQVASAQTLQRRKVLPQADVVIIDECHRWFKFYGEWIKREDYAATYFLGMSATPWTKGLGKFFDDLVTAATTQELIDAGYLAPFRVFAPSHPDLSGVGTVETEHGQDYNGKQLSERMQRPQLTADAVKAYQKHGEDRPCLVFAVDRAHGKALVERFTAAGVPTAYIDGTTPQTERTKIELALKHGRVKVVVNIGCLTMGCDWPFVSCISLCRPTKSEMLYVQIVGRGLRTCEGKTDCVILDHSDTTQRLGFVTDIVHNHLDDGKPNKAATARKASEQRERPDECLSCGALRKPGLVKCWQCGFEATRPNKVVTAPGKLAEVKKSPKATMADKQRWYSMLLGHAQRRGIKPGWAYHKFHDKFGVYPNHQLRKIALDPDAEVSAWITSRNIRWAKGKGRNSYQQEARP